MSDDNNHKNFIAYLRGLSLTWIIAFPLAFLLYGNFPEVSITIMSIAVVISILVTIVFPYRKRKKQKQSQPLIVLKSDTKLVTFARMFMSKLDGFIFTFMFTMSGTMLVLLGNMLAVGAMLRINYRSLERGYETNPKIFLCMVCSWFILWFFRWYMKNTIQIITMGICLVSSFACLLGWAFSNHVVRLVMRVKRIYSLSESQNTVVDHAVKHSRDGCICR